MITFQKILKKRDITFQYITLNNADISLTKPLKREFASYNYGFVLYNLPLTTDISKWGTIIKQDNNVITLENSKYPGSIIVIEIHSDKQSYEFLINGKVKFKLKKQCTNLN